MSAFNPISASPAGSRCLLIDGHALMYRAFFAMPAMTTADGRQTNALFGFIRMLQQLQRIWQPTHLAVAFDQGLPAIRMQLLPTYKAQRPVMPETLRPQFDYVREYLLAARIVTARIEGQEADDILASLAKRLAASKTDAEILIASGDKDLLQLITSRIALVSPAGKPFRTDTTTVIEKTGVPPDKIAAWLALTGDSADNIPGVHGIGPKIAARLLADFGSIAAIRDNLERVRPESIRDAIRHHADLIDRNLALMTLNHDLPVPADPWETFSNGTPDTKAVLAFAERYEIKFLTRPTAPAASGQGLLNI